jgi:hypothetical protein
MTAALYEFCPTLAVGATAAAPAIKECPLASDILSTNRRDLKAKNAVLSSQFLVFGFSDLKFQI